MNPVLILTRNNLALTKQCVESVKAQDVTTEILIYDNGSTDGTNEWLRDMLGHVGSVSFSDNRGVSAAWNMGLDDFFSAYDASHVLVLNNDTVIPPTFYSELLSYDVPFVTGVATNNMTEVIEPHDRMPLSPHPDFSAFLIRRDCWEKVGPFDERMVLYCSDCDFHVRAHRLGMPLWKANAPYFHINSQTLHRAAPEDRKAIQEQANRDRAVFQSIYDCLPGTDAYSELFK